MINKRIIYTQDSGCIAIVIPANSVTDLIELATSVVPAGVHYEIIDASAIPSDRTLRDAWEHDTTKKPNKVKTNIPKARKIAHGLRRMAREKAFSPYDVLATIPASATSAENARIAIRNDSARKQVSIDATNSEIELLNIIKQL